MSEESNQKKERQVKVNCGSSSNSRRGKSTGPYLAVIIVLVLGLGVCMYFLVQRNGEASPVASSPVATPANVSTDNGGQKEDSKDVPVDMAKVNGEEAQAEADKSPEAKQEEIDPDSLIAKIGRTLQLYYAASSPEDKLKYVIDPARIQPLMQDWYFRSPLRASELASMSVPQSFPFEGNAYWRAEVFFKDGTKGFAAMRIIDGEPKVDWESEVRYNTKDWEKWLDGKDGKEGDFRVYAIVDQYYPPKFSDRSRYGCLKLRVMGSSRTLFAYLNMKDPDQMPLIEQLNNGQMTECTLRLKLDSTEGATPLAEVEKVLSSSWIATDKSDES